MIGRTNVGGGGKSAPKLQDKSITASGTYIPDAGYDGFSKITASFNESEELSNLRKLIDGTATTLTVPSNVTKVKAYLCWQSSSSTTLVAVDLGSVTTIERHAFYNNQAIEVKEEEIDGVKYFPRGVSNIGEYAFYYAGYNKRSKNVMVLHPTAPATIGQYAFQYGNIAKVKGTYQSIGNYAFQNCNVDETDITVNGSIGNYAFQACPITKAKVDCKGLGSYALNISNTNFKSLTLKVSGAINSNALDNCQYLEEFTLDESSVITGTLGNYAFRGLGARRSGTNTIKLDFSKSTFTTIGSYAFYPSSTSYPMHNMQIILPNSVVTVNSNAFQYLKDSIIEFTSEKAPTISATSTFGNLTNVYVLCPANSINDYRTKPNFTTIAANIRGKATELATLPELNAEGYELTWYHDMALTNPVTADDVISETETYYCTAAETKVGYLIKYSELNCKIHITDKNGNVYLNGFGVRLGTELTLNVTANEGTPYPYTLTVNGVTFNAGDTYTVGEADVSITAIYWDNVNVPLNPNFAENSWEMIKLGCQLGLASELWHVGDTKPFTSKSGKNYTLRIADMTAGRYNLADGSGTTNGVLEFVECYNLNGTTSWTINSSSKEGYYTGGGYAMSDMANKWLVDIFNDLPDDIQAAISEITLNEYSYTSPSPRLGNHKLFLPAETEMFDARHYSAEGYQAGCPKYAQFGYYAENNTNAARIKKNIGSTSGRYYWLRSPYSGNGYLFCQVDSNGSYNYYNAGSTYGVAPCFAI